MVMGEYGYAPPEIKPTIEQEEEFKPVKGLMNFKDKLSKTRTPDGMVGEIYQINLELKDYCQRHFDVRLSELIRNLENDSDYIVILNDPKFSDPTLASALRQKVVSTVDNYLYGKPSERAA